MSGNCRLVVGSLLAALAPALLQAQGPSHPNLARGFDGDALHDFSGIDSVNLFNLSGQLTIPLVSRTIDGGLSYGLTLVWSSNDLWDLFQVAEPQPGDPPPPDSLPCSTAPAPDLSGDGEDPMGSGTVTCADPSKGSNAGLGFRVHPGRLYRPGSTPNATNAWIYEDGSGGSHRFVAKVHADDGMTDVGQCFTRDNSRLRLRIPGASNCTTNPTSVLTADVEFGNGVIHRFTRTTGTGQFLLTKILDRFGNEVNISRPTSGQSRWVIMSPDPKTVPIVS